MKWLRDNAVGLVALLVAVAAFVIAVQQQSLTRHQAMLHLTPEINSSFDVPTNGPPLFVIGNAGVIPATSVAVGYRRYTFDRDSRKIIMTSESCPVFSPGALFCETLKPTQFRKMTLRLGTVTSAKNLLDVYQFDLRFFRDADMKEYARTEIYFVDNGTPIPRREFVNAPEYQDIMSEIESYRPAPSPPWARGALSTYTKVMEEQQRKAQHPPERDK